MTSRLFYKITKYLEIVELEYHFLVSHVKSKDLVVHVGVSDYVRAITLEQCAWNTGYTMPDVDGWSPPDGVCMSGSKDCLTSSLDLSVVCQYVMSHQEEVEAKVSMADTGRYLCDYVYYISLNIAPPSSTAFIHVPPLNSPYTANQLAQGIRLAIKAMLR